MNNTHIDTTIRERLRELDSRYEERAYAFVLMALEEVVGRLPRRRHVTGEELVEGCRDLAIRLYGPISKTVLEHWNISTTRDFGEIVFNLLEVGVLSKDQDDDKSDFDDIFDFADAFEVQYPWGGRPLR
jgi:uncharacterized repeat protein (TIGR04138 family)